jgi:hypothetical protein
MDDKAHRGEGVSPLRPEGILPSVFKRLRGRDSRKMQGRDALATDSAVLREFVAAYCRKAHGGAELCDECRDLLEYALGCRAKCPLEPKPKCSQCLVHCYREPYRSRIRQAMRVGAAQCVRQGRFGMLAKFAVASLRDRLRRSRKKATSRKRPANSE